MKFDLTNRSEYVQFLNELKERIRIAQTKAVLAVNKELISLYWDIGKSIVEKQEQMGWGMSVVKQLAEDLRRDFSDLKGFSPSNIWRMRAFYLAYTEGVKKLAQPVRENSSKELAQLVRDIDGVNLPQVVTEIPWGHNVVLLEKIKGIKERLWYAEQIKLNGWSRNVLVHQIESDLYGRQAIAVKTTNFPETLPYPQSELVEQTLKDPYIFDFLTLSEEVRERDIEKQLLKHITKFLLELGSGFAFIGNQYHVEIEGTDYYIDLLFYHLKLRCYVAIELKTGEFKPEYAGKINFYLSAIDEMLKSSQDNPSIGMILCKIKNRLTVEYALKDMSKPIGVAEYKMVRAIPKKLKASLPTVEELEAEFEKDLKRLKK
ncbi:DUF1016 family protein [bacterium]|nr:DUF1016 family protein [bacterium]